MQKFNVDEFSKFMTDTFDDSPDLIERDLVFANTKLKMFYLTEMTDTKEIYQSIMMSLQEKNPQEIKPENIVSHIEKKVLFASELELVKTKEEALEKLLKSHALIVVEGANEIICVNAEKILARPISIPPTSTVIKGPRDGFNESLKQNLALVRTRLATEKLATKFLEVGRYTKTSVAVVYIKGLADEKVVKMIQKRIKQIEIDGIVDSFYISTFLQERPGSIFRQIGDTEKPDILTAKMLEGRVAVMVDGSPIALTLPYILLEDLQDSNDYYQSEIRVWFIRAVRLISVLMATLLPAVYVSMQIYHCKIIPTEFLTTIINTTKSIPFTPFSELIFVMFLFEILYEANLRMPQYLGLALSIVGALILGETAVNAGLVSPPTVMIVALSGLALYTIPNLAQQFSLIRLVLVIVGGILGIYGILMAILFLISYMCSFDSYGAAYLGPIAPYIKQDQKDFIFKQNVTDMKYRPQSIDKNQKNSKRVDKNGKDKL